MAGLPPEAEDEILAALSTKDTPALRETVEGLPSRVRDGFLALARLSGGAEVIDAARRELPAESSIRAALDSLDYLAVRCGADAMTMDLADLHGYRYHTGVTFAVHVPEFPGAVVRGGRYDNIGDVFGRARPAVGLSIYLRELAGLHGADAPRAILAPDDDDAGLREIVRRLRQDGQIVVQRLPEETGIAEREDFIFDRELRYVDDGWQVVSRDDVPLVK